MISPAPLPAWKEAGSVDPVAQFAGGDLDAFEALFRRYQGEVYGWIVRLVRDPGTAEDLTVETFWRVWRAHQRFDAARNFGAWARRIATNAALDHLRAMRSRPRIVANAVPEWAAGTTTDPALDNERAECIRQAFRQLPARLQAVATLALIEERPYEEIGEALGISLSAVKSRAFRAVRLLREKLKRAGIDHE